MIQNTVITEIYLFHICREPDNGDHCIAFTAQFANRVFPDRSTADQVICTGPGPGIDVQRIPGIQNMAGHTFSHNPKPYESNRGLSR